jgi:hypothetical protein
MSDFKIVQLLNPIEINVNIHPMGVYNNATAYGVGDSVSYGNSSYICILPTTGNLPTNTTYWQLLASASTNKLETVVRNNLGFTVPSGSAVYLSGNIGNVPLIALSQANTELTSTKTIGITAAPIANNSNGTIIVFGLAENLNTSAYAVGSALWLSPTVAGGLTVTKPSAPDHMVFIGVVTRSHPTQGTIEVKIQNGFELEELHNVAISSLTDNQVLKYDAPNLLWKNETLISSDVGLGSVPNVDATNPANIVQTSSYRFVTDSEKSSWNGKENAITIGTTAQYWRGDKSFQTLDKSAVGLGNVDNTSDANKPVSTATQTALNLKVDKAGDTMTGALDIDVTLAGTTPLLFIKNISPNGVASLLTTNDMSNFLSFGVTGSTITGLPIPNDEAFLFSSNAINAATTLADGFKWYQDGTQVASIINAVFTASSIDAHPVNFTGLTQATPTISDFVPFTNGATNYKANLNEMPVSTAQQTAIDAKVANNLTASTTVAPSKTAVNTALALKVAKAGDTMTNTLTVTGANGVEFAGIQVNNTNTAGYCAINARADDGEVIQIAALNSGGSGNAYGMWTANQFGLYSKRTLNILTDTAGAEIKFATGTGATEVAKIDSTGKFSSNGISLNSGTVENVPTPVAGTDAANKDYIDNKSIINALIFG